MAAIFSNEQLTRHVEQMIVTGFSSRRDPRMWQCVNDIACRPLTGGLRTCNKMQSWSRRGSQRQQRWTLYSAQDSHAYDLHR
jgi:hypothetical protein